MTCQFCGLYVNWHMFYLPYSVYELVRGMYVLDSHNMHPLQLFLRDYVNMIAAKYPFLEQDKRGRSFYRCLS